MAVRLAVLFSIYLKNRERKKKYLLSLFIRLLDLLDTSHLFFIASLDE